MPRRQPDESRMYDRQNVLWRPDRTRMRDPDFRHEAGFPVDGAVDRRRQRQGGGR